jgi:hypothetical protein
VQALTTSAGAYAATEAANASPLQTVNAPAKLLELQAQVRKLFLEQQAEVQNDYRVLQLRADLIIQDVRDYETRLQIIAKRPANEIRTGQIIAEGLTNEIRTGQP